MQLLRIFVCFLLGWLLIDYPVDVSSQSIPAYKRMYWQAEKLSSAEHPTDQSDQFALALYKKVINLLEKQHIDAPFLLKAYVSTGAFLQALNRNQEAIPCFEKAFLIKKNTPGIPDSILFKPLVYCGNSYYKQDRLDAAGALYNKARAIAEHYPHISEVERLYNTLGVMAYATGNYNKSIVFYEKALNTLQSHVAVDKALLVTYKSNLASAYRKLKRYDTALKLYKEALPYGIETDKLMHNIGAVYLARGQNQSAIAWLKKVKYEDQKKLNDLGKAYLNEKDISNATFYLQQAEALNIRLNHSHKNSDHGITLKYLADISSQQNMPAKALLYYQQAINNLLLDFDSADIYTNPANFNSAFNGIELLETLLAKAEAFKLLYIKNTHIKELEASLQTYLAFYKLADHIQRIYDTDDARLLISSRKYASHQQPIEICKQLYSLTKNKTFIEQAFYLDEENKANTLSLYLQESKLKAKSGIPIAWLKQESSLKQNITRLSLQASGVTDSILLVQLKRAVNDSTIQLLAVQRKVHSKTDSRNFNNTINIAELQKLIPPQSAILSYHLGEQSILCFVISNNQFEFFSKPLPANFSFNLKQFYRQAQVRSGNNIKQIRDLGQNLYHILVEPAEKNITGKNDLMIIPDDELNFLPFELLVNKEGINLLKQYTITYNYSCVILQNNSNSPGSYEKKLGMAPFDQKVMTKSMTGSEWVQLPSSKKEIEDLGGVTFYNKYATKYQFVNTASQYNVIHLATHAYANDRYPSQSYIAFYPILPNTAISHKLYLPEIYNLKLDKATLVVLSACESGSGELVKGEGIMSLSRAFSYAGCNNIITTMWKADDASTAYLSAKLHHYIQKGYTINYALQQARLDYLSDEHIPPSKKLPGYWAHMRMIGSFQKQDSHHYLAFVIGALIIICMAFVLKNRKRFNAPGRYN